MIWPFYPIKAHLKLSEKNKLNYTGAGLKRRKTKCIKFFSKCQKTFKPKVKARGGKDGLRGYYFFDFLAMTQFLHNQNKSI